jgi:DNA adenine methylase
MKGRAILTINDHQAMRQVFAGMRTEKVRIDYTIGGAGKAKSAGELIVRSW